MKNILILIYVLAGVFFFISEIHSQPITWRKTYHTIPPSFSGLEGIRGIAQTDDGGYIAAGWTRYGSTSGYLFTMGINPYGDSLWFRVYNNVFALKILKINDGNFMILTFLPELVKINSIGGTIWTKRLRNNLGCTEFKYVNNEFYICGQRGDYPFLLKVDSSGNEIFYKEYDFFVDGGIIRDIIVNDNDIFLYGQEISPTFKFLIRADSMGNVIYIKNYELFFYGASILKTPFKESIFIGGRESVSGIGGAALMKTDTSGNITWKKNYDSASSFLGRIEYVLNDINGGIISLGTLLPHPMKDVARLIKFDYDGNVIWRKEYGFSDTHYFSNCIIQTLDSGYIIGGNIDEQSTYAFHIVKTDKLGNVPVSIQNGNSVLPSDFELYQNYPNPFNPSTTISFSLKKNSFMKLKVFDIIGKEIKVLVNEYKQAGSYNVNFNDEDLTSGIYFYQIEADDYVEVKKMMFLK